MATISVPDRPPTGYMLYCQSIRGDFSEKTTMCQVNAESALRWKALSEEERGRFGLDAAPAWVVYYQQMGKPAKARALENKLTGSKKRVRSVSTRRHAAETYGYTAKKHPVTGKKYFHDELTGLASLTRVMPVDLLLQATVPRTNKGHTTGWLLFRHAKKGVYSADFKTNTKEAGNAWKNTLTEAERETYKKQAAAQNASGAKVVSGVAASEPDGAAGNAEPVVSDDDEADDDDDEAGSGDEEEEGSGDEEEEGSGDEEEEGSGDEEK
jgi:hypothetical protein